MRHISLTLTVLLLIGPGFSPLASGATPPPATEYDPNNPPAGVFSDEWLEYYLGGDKIGYSQMTLARHGQVVHTLTRSFMKIARGGMTMEIEGTETTQETLDGKPIRFSSRTLFSGQPMLARGVISDDKLELNTVGPGYENTETLPFSPDALMIWGLTRESILRGLEPGTAYSLEVFSPGISAQQALPARIEVIGPETFSYRGQEIEGIRANTTIQAGPVSLTTASWMTPGGQLLRSEMEMMGMPLTMVAVDRETALAEFHPAEFFLSSLIPIDQTIPPDATQVTYRLSLVQGDFGNWLPPETDYQSVSRDQESNTITVTVTKADHRELDLNVKLPATQGFIRYLAANRMLNSRDPKVIALAEQAVDGAPQSPIERAYRLTTFVNHFIDEKNLAVGFASAREVIDNPEGDCSEHAVLLAALGRAVGIPSRVAAGLYYLPAYEGRKNVMGYHMWTQFYLGGDWVDFDAMSAKEVAAPTRIALMTSPLDEESLTHLGLEMLEVMGRLKVEVVDVVQ